MQEKDKKAYLEFLKGLLKDQPYVEIGIYDRSITNRKILWRI